MLTPSAPTIRIGPAFASSSSTGGTHGGSVGEILPALFLELASVGHIPTRHRRTDAFDPPLDATISVSFNSIVDKDQPFPVAINFLQLD